MQSDDIGVVEAIQPSVGKMNRLDLPSGEVAAQFTPKISEHMLGFDSMPPCVFQSFGTRIVIASDFRITPGSRITARVSTSASAGRAGLADLVTGAASFLVGGSGRAGRQAANAARSKAV